MPARLQDGSLRLAARIAAVAALYVLLAKVGLRFATVGSSVTLVWPPTGLALAALALFSWQMWPAIAIGAFVVNATTAGVGMATAAGMAAGHTLEAVIGVFLLRRFNFRGLRRDPTVPIHTIASSLMKMDGQIERVNRLLDDLLDLTRLRVDKIPSTSKASIFASWSPKFRTL